MAAYAKAKIGIIGGTGVCSEDMLEGAKKLEIRTPYGRPSSKITVGSFKGEKLAFLFRHGESHSIPPHRVNYHANVYALKMLGVERVIGIAAVGSLNEKMKPGDIVIPHQFIDMTKLRPTTFYDGPKVVHVSLADPFCSEMRPAAFSAIENLRLRCHKNGTYICIEGPRFSTRAESNLWRAMKADIIGMTLIPEVTLAREKEMCYLTIATVTDYDCWKEGAVSAEEVTSTMKRSTENVKRILDELILKFPKIRNCACKSALHDAEI
jgi:5'-methylthioadenosine phosphorylase